MSAACSCLEGCGALCFGLLPSGCAVFFPRELLLSVRLTTVPANPLDVENESHVPGVDFNPNFEVHTCVLTTLHFREGLRRRPG